jgi:YNFM family putative membrane transporter
MVASCALLAVPTLLCALAPSFGALLAFRALQGVFIPGLTAVAVAYIADLVGPEALGGAVGGWIAATVAGGLIGRVASGVIADQWDWRVAFVIFAVLTAACAALLAVSLPRTPQVASAGWRQAYRGMFAHLRNRRLVGAFVIGGALFFGFIGIFTYLPYYLTAPPFSLPPGLVAFAYVSYLAGVFVSPIAGRLSARVSRRAIMGTGLVIAMAAILMSGAPALPIIVLSLFGLCAGMFTAQAVAPAYVNATAPRDKGGAGALYLMAYYLGGTLGGVIPGLAWQAFAWPGVMAICIAALLTAFASAWFLCRE